MTKRYIFIGDIHGCLTELKELIDSLALTSKDKVISLGDLVDKGPQPVEVVKFIKDSGFESLIGNHEQKYLKYYKHEQKQLKDPKYKIPSKLSPGKQWLYNRLKEEDLLSWLASRPSYFHIESVEAVGVHGGLVCGLTLPAHDTRELYYRRYITLDGKFLSLEQYEKEPNKAVHWSDYYTGPYKHVFYGHSVRSITKPYIVEYKKGIFTYGIDTGCVHGGFLTAAIITPSLSGEEFISFKQIEAKQVYNGLKLTGDEL